MVKHPTIEAYMAALPDDQRAVLEALRATIRAAAPEATEQIAYDMPAFKANGRFLVSYAAYKDHFSLFPASGAVLDGTRRRDRAVPHRQGHDPVHRRPAAVRGRRDQAGQGAAGGDRGARCLTRSSIRRIDSAER